MRVIPSVLVSFVDLAVAYQLTTIMFGVARGLFLLDVGAMSDFSALIREFHRWEGNTFSFFGGLQGGCARTGSADCGSHERLLCAHARIPRWENEHWAWGGLTRLAPADVRGTSGTCFPHWSAGPTL